MRTNLGRARHVVTAPPPVAYYASEARGYGLVLGFATLALLCWSRAAADERRKVFIPLLACSVAAAVASHYYAILILVPLGAGELTRTWIKRKVDIPMWLALSAGLLPFCCSRRQSQRTRLLSAFLGPSGVAQCPQVFLLSGIVINLILVAVAATILRRRRSTDNVYVAKPIPLWQSVTFIMLVALPVVAMIVAKLVTHAYTERYALSAMLGGAILITWALCQVAQGRPVVAAVLASICTINFVANSVYAVQEHHALRHT